MTGIERAAGELTPNAIQGRANHMQQQQMNLQQTAAETERIKAEKDKAVADALLAKTNTEWVAPKTQAEMKLWGHQGENLQATTAKQKAETSTIEAMRDPNVKHTLQQIAQSVAQTSLTGQQEKTEAQHTTTQTEVARNAREHYKAQAAQAVTIANELAYKLKNLLPTETQQKIDIADLQIAILKNDKTKGIIENILRNQYGHMTEYLKNFKSITSTGAALGAPKGDVIKLH